MHRKRKSLLRKKLLETKDQKGPEDVLAVMRTMSPLSPMLRKEVILRQSSNGLVEPNVVKCSHFLL